jgi:hypothetical protein
MESYYKSGFPLIRKSFSSLFLFLSIQVGTSDCYSQHVGLGTSTPEARLHIRSTGWIKTIFENDAGQPRGYIGSDNNGTVTLAANAFWNGSSWIYPNTGVSMYMLMHRVNNRFEFRVRPEGGSENIPMVINTAGRVGIGTTSPEQLLSVGGGMVVDQNNLNTGTAANMLRFGSSSGEGIGSKRNSGSGQYGLGFYTSGLQRMTIANNGNIGINNQAPKSRLTIYHPGSLQIPLDMDEGHALTIFDSSFFSFSEPRLALNVGINSLQEYAYIRIKRSTNLNQIPRLLLNPLAEGAVVVGGGGDGSSYSQEAKDYKFIVGWASPALFDNKVDITGNLTVQNGKGIIRSNDGVQQKKQVKIVTVVDNLNAGQTKSYGFSWVETFGGPPDAYVGGIAPGSSGGWAEVIMTVAADNTTGGTLWVNNPRNTSVIVSFNVKVIGIGPQ